MKDNQQSQNTIKTQPQSIDINKSSNELSARQQTIQEKEEEKKFKVSLISSQIQKLVAQSTTLPSDVNSQNQQNFVSTNNLNPQHQKETTAIYDLINKTYSSDNTPFF